MAEQVAEPAAAASRRPDVVARARRLRGWPLLVLGLLAVLLAAEVLHQALRIADITIFDEYYTTVGGRYVSSHLPHSLWDTTQFFHRGPERLTALLAAVTNQLGPSTAADLRLLHATQAVCFVGAALPAYGLARTAGATPRWALGAGAATVCVPSLVYGTTLLNAAPSFVLTTAFLWLAVVAALRGGWRWDLAALVLLGLATLARVSTAALLTVLVVTVAVEAVAARPRDVPRAGAARAIGARLVGDHALVLAVLAAGVLLVVTGRTGSFTGDYGTGGLDLPLGALRDRLTAEGAQVGTAFAFVPAAVGLAWLARGLWPGRDPAARVVGVAALTAVLTLTYVNRIGGFDDRYLLPITALIPVGFAAALSRREVPKGLTVLVAVWLARAIITKAQIPGPVPGEYLYRPSGYWFSQVVLGRARTYLPFDGAIATLLVLLGVAGCLAVAFAPSRWRASVGAVALAVSVGLGLAGGVWAMHGLVEAQPLKASSDLTRASWIDRATGGRSAGPVSYLAVDDPAVPNAFQRLQAFNESVDRSVDFGSFAPWSCCAGFSGPSHLDVDARSGSLSVSGASLPKYLVALKLWTPAYLAVTPVADSTDLFDPARVERIEQPPRVAWAGVGAEPDGWGVPARAFVVRVFRAGALEGVPPAATCLRADVVAPPPPATGTVRGSVGSTPFSLEPGEAKTVEVPLPGLASGDVSVRVRASRSAVLDDGRRVTVALSDVRTQRCSAATG